MNEITQGFSFNCILYRKLSVLDILFFFKTYFKSEVFLSKHYHMNANIYT